MTLTPGTGRPTVGDVTNRGLFLRLGTVPVIRVWSGNRRMRVAANDLDTVDQIYESLAILRDVPEIDRLINGEARRVTFQLNGLNKQIADLVDVDMESVQGSHARIGHMRYDRNWRPTGAIRWAFDGVLDEIGLEQTQSEKGHEWTLSVSMSSALVERNRPQLLFWTPQDQSTVSPTDTGFRYIPTYNVGTTRPYPPR